MQMQIHTHIATVTMAMQACLVSFLLVGVQGEEDSDWTVSEYFKKYGHDFAMYHNISEVWNQCKRRTHQYKGWSMLIIHRNMWCKA